MQTLSRKMFSIIELLIVITVMTILAVMGFYVTKGVKDGARTTQTESTINTCKVNIENVQEHLLVLCRTKNMVIYKHPLFSMVWPSNRVWTFKREDKVDSGRDLTANGLMDMVNIGNLGVENKSIMIEKIKYPDGSLVDTLVDGWGFPILLMRNEMPYFISQLNPGDKAKNIKPDDVVALVYQNRQKASMGQYAKFMSSTDKPGANLYEWNDKGFDHVDSKGVKEPSYEVAPYDKTSGYRAIGVEMYGKIAVPYNDNDFDFLSVGKDGKIGNLIKSDNCQDRWREIRKINSVSASWVGVTPGLSTTDPDMDNIITFNRYKVE